MGWKSVKEHYQISHTVHISEGSLCIGSAYISEIIAIRPDGVFAKRYTRSDGEIFRYQQEIESDIELFLRLWAKPDVFEKCVPVFLSDAGRVLRKECEAFGWPNVTHDGVLMYENTSFLDESSAAIAAARSLRAGLKSIDDALARHEEEAQKLRELRQKDMKCLDLLRLEYPSAFESSTT